MAEANELKLGIITAIAGGQVSPQGVQRLRTAFKEHIELALPYLAEKTKISSSQNENRANDPQFWRKVLANKQKHLAKENADTVVLEPLEPETFG